MAAGQIEGWIHHESLKEEGSDDSEDDEVDDTWFDITNINEDRIAHSKFPKRRKVAIVDWNKNRHSCNGHFPFLNSFWRVEVKVLNGYLRAPPVYSIRTDADVNENLVMMFIHDCLEFYKEKGTDALNGTKACFEAFYRQNSTGQNLNFLNLEEKLNGYLKEEKKQCCLTTMKHQGFGQYSPQDHSPYVLWIKKSELGCTLLCSVSHPSLVQVLCVLLPNSFPSVLVKLTSLDQRQIAEDMTQNTPWEWGFKQIIRSKLRVWGVEATLSAIDKAGLLPGIPQLQRDALYIYEAMKTDAKLDGHMYSSLWHLKNSRHFKNLSYPIIGDMRWACAFKFLKEHDVVVQENFNNEDNFFLQHNWQAEVDTVATVLEVIKCHSVDPLVWDVDFNSSDFDKMWPDPDQLHALHVITHLPLAVLSGRGGCGKTTVVTTLLQHLCQHVEQLALESDHNNEDIPSSAPELIKNEIESEPETSDLTSVKNEYTIEGEALMKIGTAATVKAMETESGSVEQTENDCNCGDSKSTVLKRQVVSDLLKLLRKTRPSESAEVAHFKESILLTAPTGKAARLLGCKSRLPSATLHSVTASYRTYLQSDKKNEETKWRYASVEVLVVDECSLVSVQLFASVTKILVREAKLRKIILLGDIRQLPSIQPGNFLMDLFKTFSSTGGRRIGFSVELTRNHRAESQLIVDNAGRISQQLIPTFDPRQRFHFMEIPQNGNDSERDEIIRHLLRTSEDLESHITSQFVSFRNSDCDAINELCCQHYNSHSILEPSRSGKKTRYKFEIGDKICLRKNSLVSNHRQKLLDFYISDFSEIRKEVQRMGERDDNVEHRGHLAGPENLSKTLIDATSALDLITGHEDEFNHMLCEMKERDLRAEELMAERRKTERLKRAKKQSCNWKKQANILELIGEREEKLCNGEIFFIMDENLQDGHYLVLSDQDPDMPRVVCVQMAELKNKCRLRHSWARTIHTYQGSESDTVVYMLGKPIPQNWQHVYTAVTRGRKAVYVVGKWPSLQVALNRRTWPRHSHLSHRLQEMMMDQPDLLQEVMGGFASDDDSWIYNIEDFATVTASDLDIRPDSSTSASRGTSDVETFVVKKKTAEEWNHDLSEISDSDLLHSVTPDHHTKEQCQDDITNKSSSKSSGRLPSSNFCHEQNKLSEASQVVRLSEEEIKFLNDDDFDLEISHIEGEADRRVHLSVPWSEESPFLNYEGFPPPPPLSMVSTSSLNAVNPMLSYKTINSFKSVSPPPSIKALSLPSFPKAVIPPPSLRSIRPPPTCQSVCPSQPLNTVSWTSPSLTSTSAWDWESPERSPSKQLSLKKNPKLSPATHIDSSNDEIPSTPQKNVIIGGKYDVSPPKLRRVDASHLVNTPFRENFSHSLSFSIDAEGNTEVQPTEQKSPMRKSLFTVKRTL